MIRKYWFGFVVLGLALAGCGSPSASRPTVQTHGMLGDPGWSLEWLVPDGVPANTPLDVQLVLTVPVTLTNQRIEVIAEGGGTVLAPTGRILTPTIIPNEVYTQTFTVLVPEGAYLRLGALLKGINPDGVNDGNGGEMTLYIKDGVVLKGHGNPKYSQTLGPSFPMPYPPYPIATPEFPIPTKGPTDR